MTNKRSLEAEVVYHVYNRGFNKQQLFFDSADYERFMNSIIRYKSELQFLPIKLQAFSILPNHFHFLIYESGPESPGSENDLDARARALNPEKEPGDLLSVFMNRVQLAYAMYFNSRYGDDVKKGLKMPVFEGRFQAKEIRTEAYLHQVGSYIEFNALKHGLVEDINDWPYTSYHLDYPVLNPDFLYKDLEKKPQNLIMKEDFDPLFE